MPRRPLCPPPTAARLSVATRPLSASLGRRRDAAARITAVLVGLAIACGGAFATGCASQDERGPMTDDERLARIEVLLAERGAERQRLSTLIGRGEPGDQDLLGRVESDTGARDDARAIAKRLSEVDRELRRLHELGVGKTATPVHR